MNKLMLNKRYLVVILLFLSIFLGSEGQLCAQNPIRVVSGRVIKVSDGDTIKVVTAEGTDLKIRLAGIDAPETRKLVKGVEVKPGQPYGEESKAFTEKFLNGKEVRVEIYAMDLYRRILGFVFVDGKNLNLELVKAGLAEVYDGGVYGPYKKQLGLAEYSARFQRLNMWSQGSAYMSPREFRKMHRVQE